MREVDDATVDRWLAMMYKYGTTLTCYDMFLDTKRLKDRLMSDEEQVESIVRDLKLCNRLGIRNMRVLVFGRPDILGRCVPYAEQYDIHMGVEVHAPWSLDHAWILRTVEVADRLNTKHLGILPERTILFRAPKIEDGVIVLDLKTTIHAPQRAAPNRAAML